MSLIRRNLIIWNRSHRIIQVNGCNHDLFDSFPDLEYNFNVDFLQQRIQFVKLKKIFKTIEIEKEKKIVEANETSPQFHVNAIVISAHRGSCSTVRIISSTNAETRARSWSNASYSYSVRIAWKSKASLHLGQILSILRSNFKTFNIAVVETVLKITMHSRSSISEAARPTSMDSKCLVMWARKCMASQSLRKEIHTYSKARAYTYTCHLSIFFFNS